MIHLSRHHQEQALDQANEACWALEQDVQPPRGLELHEKDGALLVVLRADTNKPVLVSLTLRNPHYAVIAAWTFNELMRRRQVAATLPPSAIETRGRPIATKEALAALSDVRPSHPDDYDPIVPAGQLITGTVCVLDLEEAEVSK